MRQKVDVGSGLVAGGAALLLVSLFLTWYEGSLSAWDSFELVDWLLAVLGVLALVIVASAASGGPARLDRLPWIAGAALVLCLAMLIDPPPVAIEHDRAIGAWLGLGGALLMIAGTALDLAHISVTVDVRERERRRRMAAVDRRESAAPQEEPGSALRSTGAPAREEREPRVGRRAGSLFAGDEEPAETRREPQRPEPATHDPERTQPFRPADAPRPEDDPAR